MSASEEGRGVRGGTLLGSHLSVASLRRSTAVTTSCFLFCLVLLLVVGMLLTPVAPVRAGPPQKLYLGPQSAWFKSEGVCPKTVETRDDSNNPAPVDSTTTITVECDRGGLSAGPYGPWSSSLTLQLPAGRSSVSFYYRAPSTGTDSIRATAEGLANASQDVLTTNNSFDIYWSDANMYLPVGTRRTFPVHLNAPLGYGDGVSRFITYLRWPPAGTSGFEVVQVVPQSVSSGFEIVSGPVDNTNGRVPIQSGVVRPGYLLGAETCIADVTIRTFGVPGVWEMWTSDSQVYRRDGTQVPVAQRPIRVNVTQPPSVRTDGAS